MTFTNKNKRYKPLYKQFIRLRKNIQYRRKLLKPNVSFKKQKWQTFLFFLNRKKTLKQGKGRFNLYDNSRFYIPRFGSSFKRKFKENLIMKQQFSIFYGHLSEKTIKKYIDLALAKVKLQAITTDAAYFFFELLETRLDTILYRSQFVLSFRESQYLIRSGKVKINGKIVKKKSFKVKEGDLIEIDPKIYKKIYFNFLYLDWWTIPAQHLQVNYKTLQIIYVKDIKLINSTTFFPFKIDFKSLVRRYNN